jgi:hypothetical protein
MWSTQGIIAWIGAGPDLSAQAARDILNITLAEQAKRAADAGEGEGRASAR